MKKQYYKYWGKTNSENKDEYHLAAYHMIDVLNNIELYLKYNPIFLNFISNKLNQNKEDVKNFILIMGCFHDLGKFSSKHFQSKVDYLQKNLMGNIITVEEKIHHTDLMMHYDCEFLKDLFEIDFSVDEDEFSDIIKNIYFGHHGRVLSYSRPIGNVFTKDDLSAISAFINDIKHLYNINKININDTLLSNLKEISWILNGLIIFSDWMGSNNEVYGYLSKEVELKEYKDQSIKKTVETFSKMDFDKDKILKDVDVNSIFPYIKTMTPLQDYVSKMELKNKQIIIIEDVTGSGKTEAAFILAARLLNKGLNKGIQFLLPTMATTDCMYNRVDSFYGNVFTSQSSFILAHGKRGQNKKYIKNIWKNNSNKWLSDNRKKALLSDLGVSTIDQSLLGVLKAKHQSLRLFGLFGKVLIFDEIHSNDEYQNGLLKQLIYAHSKMGGSIILMSATLSKKDKEMFLTAFNEGRNIEIKENPYPCVTTSCGEDDLVENKLNTREELERKINIDFFHSKEDVKDKLIKKFKSGSNVCWIRNTVQDSVDAYLEIIRVLGKENIVLLHSKFTASDRMKKQNYIIENLGKTSGSKERNGVLVISTQVIEQSVDVDFDYMISDLAPIDSLIQRFGRVMRHKRNIHGDISEVEERGSVFCGILSPELVSSKLVTEDWYKEMFEKGSYVYSNVFHVYQTAKILYEKKHITTPQDCRFLIESVFGNNKVPKNLIKSFEDNEIKGSVKNQIAKINQIDFDEGFCSDGQQWIEDSSITRIGDVTVKLYLYKVNNGEIKWISGKHHYDSEVSIQKYKIDTSNKKDMDLIPLEVKEKVYTKKQIKEGEYGNSLFIKINDDGFGVGFSKNKKVIITYSEDIGLSIEKALV